MKSNILDDFKWIMLRGKLPLSVQIDSKDRPLSLMTVHFDALCVAQERLFLIDRPLSDVHFGPESEKFIEQRETGTLKSGQYFSIFKMPDGRTPRGSLLY